MKRFAILLACALLASCATHYSPGAAADPYGFFSGLLHGFIAPFSLIGCMVFDSVWIVGQPNSGGPYYVGFFVGLCSMGSSGSHR